jgi:predicted enzyme related to lactoylglutathione lyase
MTPRISGSGVELSSHPAGTFCFPELNTRDLDGAKRFYGPLLGGDWFDVPSAAGTYSLLRIGDGVVAGLHRSERGAATWVCYVSVDSADRVADRAAELGGRVLAPPFDVVGVGRMAFVEDPAHAPFALWEARGMIGSTLEDHPGPCWYELATHDVARATRFYTDLLGWAAVERSVDGVGPYTVARIGQLSVAGLVSIPRERGAVSARWQVYFSVGDCDRAARQASGLKGRVVTGPTGVPEIGRFAVLADASDAVFGVFQASNRS